MGWRSDLAGRGLGHGDYEIDAWMREDVVIEDNIRMLCLARFE